MHRRYFWREFQYFNAYIFRYIQDVPENKRTQFHAP